MGHPGAQYALGALLIHSPALRAVPSAGVRGGSISVAEASTDPVEAEAHYTTGVAEAEAWLLRASYQGNLDARLELARMYVSRGEGLRFGTFVAGWFWSGRMLSSKTSARHVLELAVALGTVPAAFIFVIVGFSQ